MGDVTALQLAAFALHATTAVVWGSVATRECETYRTLRPRNPLFLHLRNLTVLGTVHFVARAAKCLVPTPWLQPTPLPALVPLLIVDDWSLIMVTPIAWQLSHYWGGRPEPPARSAVALVYGIAAAMMALTVTFPIVLGGLADPLRAYVLVYNTYMVVMFGITVRRMARRARSRRWRPGAAANAITRADVWFFAGGITVMAVAVTAVAVGGLPGRATPLGLAIDTAVNVLVTIPVAARELTHVVRGLALAGGMVVATAAAYLGGRALVAPLRAEGATPAADVALIAVLVAVWVPAQAWLRRAVHRVVLGRREHLWNDLHAFLSTLSPDAGATACCRRALVELVRVLGLRGAAIVMRDGDAIVEGEFDAEPLRAAWPRGEALDALPPALVTLDYLDELPPAAVDALMAAEVVSVVPITSPRRRWGALFATSGLLEPVPEEADAVEAFVTQLALLLDAAALLERAVAVERSLAHAEKLAAIGELASRIAHEIRNPVTAARSLAQLLARDPTAPENTEHAALILDELERVERHVRSLLHFARREEYRFEPVDVGALLEGTLGSLRPRLDALDVRLETALASGVVVHADREKLRQVVVNLLENALDAVATADDRRLGMAVSSANGTALVDIVDSGPGVPAEALDRLFEPFFTLKPHGTGLGLAIARRTIEAHGGRITASPASPHGMSFRIELPRRCGEVFA